MQVDNHQFTLKQKGKTTQLATSKSKINKRLTDFNIKAEPICWVMDRKIADFTLLSNCQGIISLSIRMVIQFLVLIIYVLISQYKSRNIADLKFCQEPVKTQILLFCLNKFYWHQAFDNKITQTY